MRERCGRAKLLRDGAGQVRHSPGVDIDNALQERQAVVSRGVCVRRESGLGGGNGAVHIHIVRHRGGADLMFRYRIDHGAPDASMRFRPGPAYVELRCLGHAHCPRLALVAILQNARRAWA